MWHRKPTRLCFKLVQFKVKFDRNIFRWSPEASILSWATKENWNWQCELCDTENLLVACFKLVLFKEKSDRNIFLSPELQASCHERREKNEIDIANYLTPKTYSYVLETRTVQSKIRSEYFSVPWTSSIVSWATRENWNWHYELSDTKTLLGYALISYFSKKKSIGIFFGPLKQASCHERWKKTGIDIENSITPETYTFMPIKMMI